MDWSNFTPRLSILVLGIIFLYALSGFLSDHPHIFLNGLLIGTVFTAGSHLIFLLYHPEIYRLYLKSFGLQKIEEKAHESEQTLKVEKK